MTKGLLFLLFTANFLLSSQCNEKELQGDPKPQKNAKELLIEENQRFVRQEARDIDNYIKRKDLDMLNSGTGLRYALEKTGKGETVRPGQVAVINYNVSLLNGTLCYSTDSTGAEEFLVEMDDVESGLHEGIQFMRVGDKGKFIIPSYLAHGIAGDRQKIPMRSPIIYDIELISIK